MAAFARYMLGNVFKGRRRRPWENPGVAVVVSRCEGIPLNRGATGLEFSTSFTTCFGILPARSLYTASAVQAKRERAQCDARKWRLVTLSDRGIRFLVRLEHPLLRLTRAI